MTSNTATLSRRQKTESPNRHLWNNHGWWWFHATFHLPDNTAQRVRFSLKTKDLETARRKRDDILARHLHPNQNQQAA